MGVDPGLAQGSLRFSLGHANNEQEIDHVLDVLVDAVSRLREVSSGQRTATYQGDLVADGGVVGSNE